RSDRLALQQSRRRAGKAGCLLDEELLQPWHSLHQAEPDVTDRSHRTEVVGEQAVKHVRGDAHLNGVEAAPAFVVFEHIERADIPAEPIGIYNGLGESCGILEAEVQALPGDRMDAMRGIAGQGETRLDEGAGKREAERPGARLVLDADLA